MEERRILIADDEPDILEMLEYALKKEGYTVSIANDGEEAFNMAHEVDPEIILLDVMMPKIDGIEVCRRLRADKKFESTTIVILTARDEEYSEIAGFDAGADDYVTKPIKIRSILKRLKAHQRRIPKVVEDKLTVGEFVIDREKYLLFKAGAEIKLPRKEFELLYLLMLNVKKVVTREKVFAEIWGTDVIVVDRTIDVHIRRIRMKIGEQHIETVKGVGYKFV